MKEKPLIALVDDEEVFLEIASMRLEADGFSTVSLLGPIAAVAQIGDLHPDLVLLDIYMPPGPSGWELALRLRENPETRNIKIAFFTSVDDPWRELEDGRRDMAKRMLSDVAFLSKTDDVASLGKKVEAILRDAA